MLSFLQKKGGLTMKDLRNGDVTAWYYISAANDGSALYIGIHQKAEAHLISLDWSGMSKWLNEHFTLGEFAPPNKNPCGFGKALELDPPDRPEWTRWKCRLPAGRDSGQERTKVRATLYSLFKGLDMFEGDTGWSKPQLLVVDGFSLPLRDRDGSLSVTLSPAMVKWLLKNGSEEALVPVVDMLRAAYEVMGEGSVSPFEFWLDWNKPRISLYIPRNGCWMNPDSPRSSLEKDEDVGYKLSTHNSDTTQQQLTFLMGLARLHDLVRRGHTG